MYYQNQQNENQNQVPHGNPFSYQGTYQPNPYYNQQGNGSGRSEVQGMIQKQMQFSQMYKNIRSTGKGTTICLTFISFILAIGMLALAIVIYRPYGGNLNDILQLKLGRLLRNEDGFFKIIFESSGVCEPYLAGIYSFPFLTLVFGGFNLLASFFACFGMIFMGYVQLLWTLVWGVVIVIVGKASCSKDVLFILAFPDDSPFPSWPLYLIFAICSLMNAIANFSWRSSKIKADLQRSNLSSFAVLNS